jgi:hypothetical protein
VPVSGSSSVGAGVGVVFFGSSFAGTGSFVSVFVSFTIIAAGFDGALSDAANFFRGTGAEKSFRACAPSVIVDPLIHTAAIAVILYDAHSERSSPRVRSIASGESVTPVRIFIRIVLLSDCFFIWRVTVSTCTASVKTTRICWLSMTFTVWRLRLAPVLPDEVASVFAEKLCDEEITRNEMRETRRRKMRFIT